MKKQLIALAVFGALAAPAFAADNSTVTLYGKLDVGFNSFDGGNLRRTQVQDYTSSIGFKGEEKLDNGLSAIFQIETRVSPDDAAGSGNLATRNSFVGVKGDFGTLLLGNYDTPWKATTSGSDVVAGPGEVFEALINQDQNAASLNYHTRQTNSVQYWSPSFSGFGFRIGYGPDEAKTSSKSNARVSVSAGYTTKELYIGAGYEKRADNAQFTKADKSVENRDGSGIKLVARYTIADATTLIGGYSRVSQDVVGAPNWERNAWTLGIEHKIDKVALRAAYASASKDKQQKADPNVKGALIDQDNGAKMYSLEASYLMSKRTQAYLFYSRINNDSDAKYGFKNSNSASTFAPDATGKNVSILGVGVQHKF